MEAKVIRAFILRDYEIVRALNTPIMQAKVRYLAGPGRYPDRGSTQVSDARGLAHCWQKAISE